VTARVIEEGSRFEVANETPDDLVVLGYEGEPYLRVGPEGVYENRRSPAVYLNASRSGGRPAADADADAPPEWRKVSDGQVARWHDHRAHWMTGDPPQVTADPDHSHVILQWAIPMRVADRDVTARGDLVWVPGPSAWPWLLLSAVIFAVSVALALTERWRTVITVLLVTVMVTDAIHAVGLALAREGGVADQLGQVAASSIYSFAVPVLGVAALWLLPRHLTAGLGAAVVTGSLVGFIGGAGEVADLSKSQIPFEWSDSVARLLVSVSLGAGLGLVAAALLSIRHAVRVTPAQRHDEVAVA
jgi:hypothetical protein